MVRAFIATEVTPEIRARVSESQEILKQCRARFTLVDPGSIHLTIRFLGEVHSDQIPLLCNVLRSIEGVPFEMKLGEAVGNNPSHPRTIWCTVHDGGASARLARRVDDAIAPLGFPRETRPFTPHVTLARVKEYHPSLAKPLKDLAGREHGTCIVKGFTLKRSTLTPQGPIYEDLLRVTW